MFQQQAFLINMILMFIDALCVIVAGYGAKIINARLTYGLWDIEDHIFAVSVLLVMFVNNITLDRVGLYSDRRSHTYWRLSLAIFEAVVIDFALLATAVFLLQQQNYSREFLLLFAALTFGLMLLFRLFANFYINTFALKRFNVTRLLIVGDEQRAQMVINALERQLSLGHQIADRLPIDKEVNGEMRNSALDMLPGILKDKEIDEVIFAVPGDRALNLKKCIDICSCMGIPARILPALWEPAEHAIGVERCQGIPFLTVHVNSFNATGLMYKRLLDLAGGLVGTILFFILYPIVGLAIKIDSPGPVLFTQERVGLNGRIFKLYKFRSMYIDAEERKRELAQANEMAGPMFKMKDDPRITRVGSFIRKTSLDEFPQFLCVLKGEMSLVGTRPPTVEEVKQYKLWHHKRISIKPGLTGLWQTSGRNKISDFDQVVRLDCKYLENWKFINDIKIILKTIHVVLARKGAL
jgi:exopolysaccharide biosynthesis polyprenyl glycosylphosphotransferase